jgi:acetyl-CoA carboxylase, biotin carboxylase subunit
VPDGPPFRRVLVANRGEIAVRIIGACRELGIETVAVYSDADAEAVFVREADQAVRLGPPPPAESYLRLEEIVDTAVRCGADAIHPGYGFLSERPELPDACHAAGLVFVGPPAHAMRLLGSKLAARDLAVAHDVPVAPGSGPLHDVHAAWGAVRELGYPLIVKPSAGGGGIGMKVIDDDAGVEAALSSAIKAAEAAFGDGTVYLERYVRAPRHVELQVLCDAHGGRVHLGERECSIQRRHQKLLEEAPSPAVSPELRARMGEAALRVAEAAGYVNAGTVEFMLDGEDFYFLEVNARLQVEHPVTEAVTGIDLVAAQLAIAAGRPLPFGQDDVRLDGHAIEFRINAENAAKKFMPSPKAITAWEPPAGEGIRLDSGVEEGSAVPPFYDSLLAKLIVHGADRDAAIERAAAALAGFRVEGPVTTIAYHRAVLESDDFRGGRLSTHFVEEHPELRERTKELQA